MTVEVREFALQRHKIPLRVAPQELFMQNQTTKLFSEAVNINPGDVVFDMGSGVGPLTIWAALEPSAHVHAVEIVSQQFDLLRQNIEDNGVSSKVTPYQGSFFNPIPKGIRADVIIADVSGIAEGPARALGWYPPYIPTGGNDGTGMIIPLLEQAGSYMQSGSRLYFPVAQGLSDSDKIMSRARVLFGCLEERVHVKFPLTPQQRADVLKYAGPQAPYIRLTEIKSRTLWEGFIYEATEPVNQ